MTHRNLFFLQLPGLELRPEIFKVKSIDGPKEVIAMWGRPSWGDAIRGIALEHREEVVRFLADIVRETGVEYDSWHNHVPGLTGAQSKEIEQAVRERVAASRGE
jgi:hypothetical protein